MSFILPHLASASLWIIHHMLHRVVVLLSQNDLVHPTGESPHQFVHRQRIERAQHLLKETDMPLAHVALESGFANQSHLTQAFKRHLGLTPRAYRQDRSIRADF